MLSSLLQRNTKNEQVDEAVTGDGASTDAATGPQPVSSAVNEDEVDIDLADPEVHKAAVFIQSGFKGFKQRKISQGIGKVDCSHSLLICVHI